MKEIHVLHILNSAHGGSAISTFELIGALSKRRIRSSLVCFNNANEAQRKSIEEMVEGRVLFIPLYWMNKRIRISFWKRPILEVINIIKTRKGHKFQKLISSFIQTHGINLIHTSTILNPEGAIASVRNNLPHVWHVRELIGDDKHFQFYNYKRWSQFVMKRCNVLVANSRVTQKCLEQFFPAEKIVYIPNGIEISNFSMKDHRPSGKVVVAMVGSVTTRWKNHDFFVRVAALFSPRQEIEFRIYGSVPAESDPYYSSIKKTIKEAGVESIVLFMNFAKNPASIMKEVDILFHPTQFESFGRIYVEAMAAGIPVVAPDEGGALEMVKPGENGLLYKTNNVYDAQDSIASLLNNHLVRKQMGIKGRALVETTYSLEQLSQKVEKLYRSVMIN